MPNTKRDEIEVREANHIANFISPNEAGKLISRTPDYITLLAREGKITATQVGKKWHVDPASVIAFAEKTEKEKALRAEAIRQERLIEKRQYEEAQRTQHTGSTKAALTYTLAILILGLSFGTTGYITTHQEANTLESFARSFYQFFNTPHTTTLTAEQDHSITTSATRATTTYTSLVVAPEEVFTAATVESVQASFSDDVSVSIDPENPDTGTIVPHFRDRTGDTYRFLIVPTPEL